ncbi:UDP-3-O-acyl-N-acetylglucosamine deacetylase, partial [bacterium]|nr:UDP-3-O-acyl-N-acetylglucosamine deacetylase [bacterium]
MSLAESAVLEEGLPTSMGKILIIDDEPGICGELEKVLIASGYEACSLSSPEKLHEGLSWGPALILLDIWMPGKDGMEVLQEIQQQPEAPAVIMMSGHASISTAVKATQMGACDFLEKPLDVDTILKKVEAALAPSREDGSSLSGRTSRADEGSSSHEEERHEEHEAGTLQVHQSIFGEQAWKGEAVPQRTLKHSTILYGQGLHSGKKSGITLEPLPANSGLHFVGVSGGVIVPAHVDFVESTGFATTLKVGPSSVQTIEHLLSA